MEALKKITRITLSLGQPKSFPSLPARSYRALPQVHGPRKGFWLGRHAPCGSRARRGCDPHSAKCAATSRCALLLGWTSERSSPGWKTFNKRKQRRGKWIEMIQKQIVNVVFMSPTCNVLSSLNLKRLLKIPMIPKSKLSSLAVGEMRNAHPPTTQRTCFGSMGVSQNGEEPPCNSLESNQSQRPSIKSPHH